MLNCAEQVQIQKYKTHAYKTLKAARVQIIRHRERQRERERDKEREREREGERETEWDSWADLPIVDEGELNSVTILSKILAKLGCVNSGELFLVMSKNCLCLSSQVPMHMHMHMCARARVCVHVCVKVSE